MILPSFVINLLTYDTLPSESQHYTLNALAHNFKSKLCKSQQMLNYFKTPPFAAASENIDKLKGFLTNFSKLWEMSALYLVIQLKFIKKNVQFPKLNITLAPYHTLSKSKCDNPFVMMWKEVLLL